jgi:hypothetical protein
MRLRLVGLALLVTATTAFGCTQHDPDRVPENVASVREACLQAKVKSMRKAIKYAHSGLENALPSMRRVFRQGLRGIRRVSGGTEAKFPTANVFDVLADRLADDRQTLARTLRELHAC